MLYFAARCGLARQGKARQGPAWLGTARPGGARCGLARRGMARLGTAWLGWARQGMARQGAARPGEARQGAAGLGTAWQGMVFFFKKVGEKMKLSKRTSYEDFQKAMSEVKDLRDLALFSVIYASYGRVGEVTRQSDKRCRPNPPLNKDNLEWTPTHLIITIKTEKSRSFRRVPTSRAIEGWLHRPILNYLAVCEYELFPYSVRWGEKRFERWFETQNIHILRHLACTHAIQGKRTKERLHPNFVARLGGWKDLNSFYSTYSHEMVEDYIDLI